MGNGYKVNPGLFDQLPIDALLKVTPSGAL